MRGNQEGVARISCNPFFCWNITEMKITTWEYEKIKHALLELRSSREPTSNWSVMYDHLADYAASRGLKVFEVNTITRPRNANANIAPYEKRICVKRRNITRMVRSLAHEIGHLICFEVGILQKYNFDEDLATALGRVAVDILAK